MGTNLMEKLKKENKTYKTMRNILKILFFSFIIFYLIVLIFFNNNLVTIFGFEATLVKTGSMYPEIKRYDFVVVVKPDLNKIKEGDIIVFFDISGKYKILHRIEEIKVEEQSLYFKTKGDNNPASDPGLRTESDIYAKYVTTVPVIGYIISFGQSQLGILAMSLNFVTLIFLTFLWKQDSKQE